MTNANVEVRPSPCDVCGSTGRCPVCSGTGRVAGEGCSDCTDGSCIACSGTGTAAEVLYKGREIPFSVHSWKRYLLYGIWVVAVGVLWLILSRVSADFASGDIDPIVGSLVIVGVGGGLLGWSFRLRHLQRLEFEALSAFYPDPDARGAPGRPDG